MYSANDPLEGATRCVHEGTSDFSKDSPHVLEKTSSWEIFQITGAQGHERELLVEIMHILGRDSQKIDATDNHYLSIVWVI